jgi:hypothetical protein
MKTFNQSLVGLVLLWFALPAALASETVATREHNLPAADVTRLVVDNRVGSVNILQGSGETYLLTVKLKGNRYGLLRKVKPVTGLDISSRAKAGSLHLKFNEDDVNADWTLTLPATAPAEISVNQGVGSVKIAAPRSAIKVDLGVGDVDVTTARSNAADIALTVGVGAASVVGLPSKSKASGVASNVAVKGEGDNDIALTVGVGDASVMLN